MWIELWEKKWNKKYEYTETNLKLRSNEKYDKVIEFLNGFEPIIEFKTVPNYRRMSERINVFTENWIISIDCTIKQLFKLEEELELLMVE